jgi:Rrf2 family protein
MTSRFALSVHVLGLIAWCEESRCAPATSGEMARRINTNPVVVRRLLCDLRRAGLIGTKRGIGGGVRLLRAPEAITLRDVYEAVEAEGRLFGLHAHPPDPCCAIGGHIEGCLRAVYGGLEETLKQRLEAITIRDVCEGRLSHAGPGNRPLLV